VPLRNDPVSDADVNMILVTYENAEAVQSVIEHVERYARSRYVFTIVDNASGPDTQKVVRALRERHPSLRWVRNFHNRMCGGGTLQALALAREPYAIYLCAHECFVLQEGWDLRCLEFMAANPRVAIAGHRIASPRYADGQGYTELELFPRFRNPEYARGRLAEPFSHIQGGFYVLRLEAVRKAGSFNPDIPHDFMDVEYCYFLESEGWELGDLPFVKSIHRNTRPKLAGYDPAWSVYHPLTPAEAIEYEAQKRALAASAQGTPEAALPS
jgi:GT2 family glycosyltransferase